MENYEDLLVERLQILTGKLAQKQRQGSLAEELDLCIKLAQLNGYLGKQKTSVQFWQSCMQIAADLGDNEEELRAVGEISKIYCKEGQMDEAERFMSQNLKIADQTLRTCLLKAEVIAAKGVAYGQALKLNSKDQYRVSVKEFLEYERALKILDEALNLTDSSNGWWWDAVAFRAELLLKLGKFEESRFEEAIDVIRTVQGGDSNVLTRMRTNAILAKIYFEMGEHRTAYDFALVVIDLYKSEATNSNYRQRRRYYSEMLLLAGRTLRLQLDFGFALETLMLARDEAEALGVEKEFIDEIEDATGETMSSQSLSREVSMMRSRKNPSPKDLEELSDTLGRMGDYQGQADNLERCRAVALNETTKSRLDKKLAKVYFYQVNNWRAVTRLSCSGARESILKGRAYEKLGDLELAEEWLLKASGSKGDESINAQTACYFYYRHRGKLTEASKLEPDLLTHETISILSKTNDCALIDPNFSYFVTRKPSTSMMKMVGSGMVMRTKTKKTSGLVLKRRRRGAGGLGVKAKRKEVEDDTYASDGGLSDFIVSDELDAEDEEKDVGRSSAPKSKHNRSIVVISDDEDEKKQRPTPTPIVQFDSPLMIRTETLEDLFDSKLKPSTSDPAKKVFVRFKPGKQIVIPISDDLTVRELVRMAQMRFEKAFPEEARRVGKIDGLSLVEGDHEGARLYVDDLLGLILSGDGDALQAHYTPSTLNTPNTPSTPNILNTNSKACTNSTNSNTCDSPSRFNSLEEDFRRKLQILSLKSDNHDEINFLKSFQERFTRTQRSLDLSKLGFDSEKFKEYSGMISKFLNLSPGLKELNLAESCLIDGDLKHLTRVPSVLDLSNNFLMKPSASLLKDCEFVNLSYNEIDFNWLESNAVDFKGLGLVGCFENCDNDFDALKLGRSLSSLKKLTISLAAEMQTKFISGLCDKSSRTEELQLFGFDWRGPLADSLIQLSYLDNLRVLDLSCNRFGSSEMGIEALCRILKRSCSLKRLVLDETDLREGEWSRIQDEGIRGNFSLELIIKDAVVIHNKPV